MPIKSFTILFVNIPEKLNGLWEHGIPLVSGNIVTIDKKFQRLEQGDAQGIIVPDVLQFFVGCRSFVRLDVFNPGFKKFVYTSAQNQPKSIFSRGVVISLLFIAYSHKVMNGVVHK